MAKSWAEHHENAAMVEKNNSTSSETEVRCQDLKRFFKTQEAFAAHFLPPRRLDA